MSLSRPCFSFYFALLFGSFHLRSPLSIASPGSSSIPPYPLSSPETTLALLFHLFAAFLSIFPCSLPSASRCLSHFFTLFFLSTCFPRRLFFSSLLLASYSLIQVFLQLHPNQVASAFYRLPGSWSILRGLLDDPFGGVVCYFC